MKSYDVESKDFENVDLPDIIKATLKKNDALKGMYIIACSCAKEEEGSDLFVTYQDAEYCVYTVRITMVKA